MLNSSEQLSKRYKFGLIAFFLSGINLLACFYYLSQRHDLLNPVWIYLIVYALAFAAYIYAAAKATSLTTDFPQRKAVIWIILILAVVFRVILIRAIPSLSTDILRYVWDGRLTCHWVNPYRWSPWDTRLAEFRDSKIWMPMEYKAYSSVYMPVSQLFFAIGYAIFHSDIYGFKLIFTLFDIGTVFVITLTLKSIGKNTALVVWYAWCPLPIIETSLAGHQDSIGIFLMMLAILLIIKSKKDIAGFVIAAAALTKGFSLLLIPMLTKLGGRRSITIALITLFYLGMPAWVFLPEFMHGMSQYLDTVHVNSSFFSLTDYLLYLITPKYHFNITSALTDLAVLTVTFWSIRTKIKTANELLRRAIIVVATCLITVPTLFPWYVMWLLPFAAIYGKKPAWSIITLAALVDLVYVYYIDRAVHWWIPIIEYLPVFAMVYREYKQGYWLDSGDEEKVLVCSDETSDLLTPDLTLSRTPAAT